MTVIAQEDAAGFADMGGDSLDARLQSVGHGQGIASPIAQAGGQELTDPGDIGGRAALQITGSHFSAAFGT